MTSEMAIGVCGWCLDRFDAVRSIELAGKELDVPLIQLGFFNREVIAQADGKRLAAAAEACGVHIVGVFVAFEGEDYSSIAAIAQTGGFMPDEPYETRLAATCKVGELAVSLGCGAVALHAGTVSTDVKSRGYATLLARVGETADRLMKLGARLLLETGRESAETLTNFIDALDRSNVGVNFDAANFVIYGTDEPLSALLRLRKRIECVHLKDAVRSHDPGVEFGQSTSPGLGDTGVARLVSKLRAQRFTGPLLVESSGSNSGIDAVRESLAYLRTLLP
ncbi:MAG: sugar phosphate isomerase/epimerase [Planctomycetes bacterium]|nr:sugar phosphate isomerase/epimerase [Planctomycetota bacterium]